MRKKVFPHNDILLKNKQYCPALPLLAAAKTLKKRKLTFFNNILFCYNFNNTALPPDRVDSPEKKITFFNNFLLSYKFNDICPEENKEAS